MSGDTSSAPEATRLVVIGSSAGGIEALSTLVTTLPQDFPAPIVLAQHLDPRRPSHLEQILQRRSGLPVVVVQDGEPTQLAAGTIYVVPSNRHVTIHNRHVGLEGDHAGRPRPSIDLLLSSAAQSYGENLIAVILTGSGSDGAAGAVDVNRLGGTVVIQNPQTALHPAMPRALPPTAVDHVVDLEGMGALLYELVTSITQLPPAEQVEDPLRAILATVSRQASIDFRQYKPTTILRRVTRRMAVTHTHNLGDYAAYLDRHPEEVGDLVMTFLIQVTEFFRDPDAFAYLRRHVLAPMIAHAREQGQVLRIWSAGCATGEEAYSLAALIADELGAELPAWNIKVFATDLDDHAITFARRALYPANVLDNLPADYRARFFEPLEQGYQVAKTLRQMVIFGQQDLARGVPFARINLVTCRNVLIYFQPELQQNVLDMFHYSLQETAGYLLLGQAETVRPANGNFEVVNKKWKIYRSAPTLGGAAADRYPPAPTGSRGLRRTAATLRDAPGGAPEIAPSDADLELLRRSNEWTLRFLPIGVVVIDRAYRILSVNSAARRVLGLRDGSAKQDFLHSARGLPYAQVRQSIDGVFRERVVATLPDLELEPAGGQEARFVTLTIAPMQPDFPGADLAVITISDATDLVQVRRRLEALQADTRQLVDELSAANRRLNDLNKELQDANEELQAANEEMMLTQEELQATNEEFEATNEEMQATNEEMETNSEELQATNEELETTNEELVARTGDQQELVRALAAERLRLQEMVELAPFYMLLVSGPGLLVEAFNPRYARLLAGRQVIGRPLDKVFHGPTLGEVVRLVREACTQNAVRVTPPLPASVQGSTEGSAEHFLVYTLVPTHDPDGRVTGAVIYGDEAPAADASPPPD